MNADTRRSATFWKGADDVPIDIIDWICPMCKRLTGHSRVCPKCGLSIKETPRRKMRPIPRSMKIDCYRKWANEIFD